MLDWRQHNRHCEQPHNKEYAVQYTLYSGVTGLTTYIFTGGDCTQPFTLTRYFQKLFRYKEINVHRFSRMAHSRQCTPSCRSHTQETPFGNSSTMLEFQTGYTWTSQRNIRERTQNSNNRYISSISKCITQKRGERTRTTTLNGRSGY